MSSEGPRAAFSSGLVIPPMPAAAAFGSGSVEERLTALEDYAQKLQLTLARAISMLEHGGIQNRHLAHHAIRRDHVRFGEIGFHEQSWVELGEVRVSPNPVLFAGTFARIEDAFTSTGGNMAQDLVVYGIRRGVGATVELGRTTLQPAPLARIGAADFLPQLRPMIGIEDGKSAGGAAQKRYTAYHLRDVSQTEAGRQGRPNRDAL